MADLGAIGYDVITRRSGGEENVGSFTEKFGLVSPTGFVQDFVPANGDAVMLSVQIRTARTSNTYAVTGVVQEAGVPVAGRKVRAFRRDTGLLLEEATTDGSGNFSMTIVGYNGEVTVVAYDDTGASPDYNALVYDRVVPL